MKPNKKFAPCQLFIIMAIISILFSVLWLIKTRGSCLDSIVSGSGNDRFMDFFNHITYARDPKNLYFSSHHACFPPLIYLMYFLFGKMLPADATVMYNAPATSSYALLLYVCYCAVFAILLFYSIYKLAAHKGIDFALVITLLIVSSNIFIFGSLERGNSSLIVCILLMRALDLREREYRVSQEVALLFIAIAAAIKIYPAIYGLLYLSEKRWKEAGRLVIYGFLCFFVPFLFFGGVEGFVQFVSNQTIIQSGNYMGMGSIRAFWNLTTEWFHLGIKEDFGIIIVIGYVILAIFASVLVKDYWKKNFLLSSIMILGPFWSGRYTAIYLTLPLILFLSKKLYETLDYLFAFLFACMFLFLTYNNIEIASIMATNLPSALEYSALYLMNIILIAEAIIRFSKDRFIQKFHQKGA